LQLYGVIRMMDCKGDLEEALDLLDRLLEKL
jgi:hypothetical protein